MRHHPRPRGAAAPSLLDVLNQAADRVAELNGTQPAAVTPLELAPADPGFDALGRHISPQQTRAWHLGRTPVTKGKEYKPTPPSVAECMAMLNACDDTIHGRRLYATLVLLWQGALRCFEALALTDTDLDETSGSILIRHGKGNKTATIKMAAWAWPFLAEWRELRYSLPNPDGPLLCVIGSGQHFIGPTAGQPWAGTSVRQQVRDIARKAGVKRRVAPHQLRHAWAVQAYQQSIPLRAIQLHLRHENIGITDTYLQGLGVGESHEQVYQQAVPQIPATALLSLVPRGHA
jgi:integrase